MSTSHWLAERRNLACENFIEAVIVCGRSEKSAIAREANRRLRPAVLRETHYELGRKMRGISRAPAISANEQFVSRAQTFFDQIGGLSNLRIKIGKRLQRLGCACNRVAKLGEKRHFALGSLGANGC